MTAFLEDLRDGVSAYGRAFRYLREKRLWLYFLLPGLLSLVFGTAVAFVAFGLTDDIAARIIEWYPWTRARGLVESAAAVLSGLLIAVAAIIVYKYVVLILIAPFMSYLSEKVEADLTGNHSAQFTVPGAVSDLVRGLRVAVRNILRELLLTGLLLLAGFIPLVGVLAAPAIFVVQSYFAGFGCMDFTLERHFGVRGSVRFVRAHKGLAVGNGTVFLLLLSVPVLGLLVAPALSTVAATIETIERLEPAGAHSV